MNEHKPLTKDEFIDLYTQAGTGTKELITEILTTCNKVTDAGTQTTTNKEKR